MRFFSLASSLLFFCSLLTTTSAVRDYKFQLLIKNDNAPTNVCTDAESQDLSSQALSAILSVMAIPKYDLKPTTNADWTINKSQAVAIRKDRELQSCPCGGSNYYICVQYGWCDRRMLRSERELTEAEVLEIKTVAEGAIRGLLNNMVATSSTYSATCINA